VYGPSRNSCVAFRVEEVANVAHVHIEREFHLRAILLMNDGTESNSLQVFARNIFHGALEIGEVFVEVL
jgi:hypothetical protein